MNLNSDFNKMKDIPVMEHECPAIEHSLQEDGHIFYAYIYIEESKLLTERNLKPTSQHI